jgi:hypothetical protein
MPAVAHACRAKLCESLAAIWNTNNKSAKLFICVSTVRNCLLFMSLFISLAKYAVYKCSATSNTTCRQHHNKRRTTSTASRSSHVARVFVCSSHNRLCIRLCVWCLTNTRMSAAGHYSEQCHFSAECRKRTVLRELSRTRFT